MWQKIQIIKFSLSIIVETTAEKVDVYVENADTYPAVFLTIFQLTKYF
jgi:hypothetical protein